VQRLLGIKPIYTYTRYAWLLSFYLTFWTTLAPLVLLLKILLEKSFQSLFANSQRYMSKIARSIFKIWNFHPCFKCFSFDLNKTPLEWNSPLSFQEGFSRYQLEIFWNSIFYIYQLKPNISIWNIPIENLILKFRRVVVRSFCFGLILSPPLALIAKIGDFVSPYTCSSIGK
jgi:hypothetical protein